MLEAFHSSENKRSGKFCRKVRWTEALERQLRLQTKELMLINAISPPYNGFE